jgi:hypothetical protein
VFGGFVVVDEVDVHPVCCLPAGHDGEHLDNMTHPDQEYWWQDAPYCRFKAEHTACGMPAVGSADFGEPLGVVDCCELCMAELLGAGGAGDAPH